MPNRILSSALRTKIAIKFQSSYLFAFAFLSPFTIFTHCVRKIGCGSEKNSNKFDSFSLAFRYFCKMIDNFPQQQAGSLDTEQQKGLRSRMIKELKERNLYNNNVLDAIASVPRHIFVPQGLRHMAYEDKPLPIGDRQTISQPSTVALQSHLLGDVAGHKVLEIGTGCGYQTAILAQMGATVYSIERQKDLCRIANKNLKLLEYSNITLCWGDGYKGLEQAAPFKAILVTCGAESIPKPLLLQLEIGGTMVIPVGEANKEQQMYVITRQSETVFNRTPIGKCSFVPMLEGVTDNKNQ